MDGRVDPARIARVAKELCDPDVVCFQEVSENYDSLAGSSGENQPELLKIHFGNYSAHFACAVDVPDGKGSRRRFGNMILSRLPVRQVFRHSLPWPPDAGAPNMPRVALEAVVEAPWGLVSVVTTHLEYYSAKQRTAQVEALRDLQIEAAGHAASPQPGKEGGPFQPVPRPASGILTADFNFRSDDPMHARVQAPLGAGVPAYRDAWQLRYPGKPHPPTLGVHDKTQWPGAPFACDFVFVTEDIAGRVEDVKVNVDTDASDHQPVLLVLRD